MKLLSGEIPLFRFIICSIPLNPGIQYDKIIGNRHGEVCIYEEKISAFAVSGSAAEETLSVYSSYIIPSSSVRMAAHRGYSQIAPETRCPHSGRRENTAPGASIQHLSFRQDDKTEITAVCEKNKWKLYESGEGMSLPCVLPVLESYP